MRTLDGVLCFQVMDTLHGIGPVHALAMAQPAAATSDMQGSMLLAAVGQGRSGALAVLRQKLEPDIITNVPVPGERAAADPAHCLQQWPCPVTGRGLYIAHLQTEATCRRAGRVGRALLARRHGVRGSLQPACLPHHGPMDWHQGHHWHVRLMKDTVCSAACSAHACGHQYPGMPHQCCPRPLHPQTMHAGVQILQAGGEDDPDDTEAGGGGLNEMPAAEIGFDLAWPTIMAGNLLNDSRIVQVCPRQKLCCEHCSTWGMLLSCAHGHVADT